MVVARTHWVHALHERNRSQRERYAALALKAIKDERAQVNPLQMRRDEQTSGVLWPRLSDRPAPESASESLVGELAIALFDELRTARRGGFCMVEACGRPWLTRLDKQRQVCGRNECVLAWRNAHRKAEDPAKVYERVKRYRAALRAKKGARRDKTGKR